VSADLISQITDEVLDEVAQWQQRPLEPIYSVVIFDALRVKIRVYKAPTLEAAQRHSYRRLRKDRGESAFHQSSRSEGGTVIM
jgi:hypothetical protein